MSGLVTRPPILAIVTFLLEFLKKSGPMLTLNMPVKLDSISIERTGALWRHARLELGIQGIDAQHAWLVALILELEWALHQNTDHLPSRIHELVQEIQLYTTQHFDAEEKIFSELNYAEEANHIAAHHKFTIILATITDRTQLQTHADAVKLYRFLRKWLVQHILVEDRKYITFFERRKIVPEANKIFNNLNKNHELLSESKLQFLDLITNKYRSISVSTPEILGKIKKIWEEMKLRIQIPIIDIQHLWLIKLIIDMDAAIDESKMTREAVLASTLEECIDYIDIHFRTEETMMDLLHYANAVEHEARHRAFEKSIQTRRLEFENENQRSAVMLVKELRNWLTNHIALEDKQFVSLYRDNKESVLNFSKKEIASGRAGIRQNQIDLYKTIVLDSSHQERNT